MVEKSKGGRKNAVSGVIVSMIDPKIAAAAAKELGVKLDGDETGEQLSVLLHQRFQDAVVKGHKYFQCAECGGGSTAEVETCPYCGEGGEAPPVGTNPASAEAEIEESSTIEPPVAEEEEAAFSADHDLMEDGDPLGGSGPEDEGPETSLVDPAVADPEVPPVLDPTEINALEIAEAAPAAMVEPTAKPERKKKQKVSPPPPAPEVPKAFRVTETPTGRALAPIAKVVVHEGQLITEETLDTSVEHWREEGRKSNVSWWRQGRILAAEVFGPESWRQRKGPDGKQLHKTFEQFCLAELGITPGYAYDQMKAARYFDESRAAQLDKSKAYLIMKFPEELRREIEAHAINGTSSGDLKKRLKEANAAKGTGKGGKVKTRGGVERTQGGGRPKTNLRVADLCHKHNVSLFAGPEGAKPVRLEKMKTGAWGKDTTIEGVVITFRVLKGKKGWFIEVKGEPSPKG